MKRFFLGQFKKTDFDSIFGRVDESEQMSAAKGRKQKDGMLKEKIT